MLTHRDLQLRALARVLAAQPDISDLALADRAGMSRRTLYRIAHSREKLLEMLREAAREASQNTLAKADMNQTDPVKTLRLLTEDFIKDDDLYLYWVAHEKFPTKVSSKIDITQDVAAYRAVMHDLIARGQESGSFRADLSQAWMLRSYEALLYAASDARNAGEIEPAFLSEAVLTMFFSGICTGSDQQEPSN